MTDFQDNDELNNDTIFGELIGCTISQKNLRQRLNEIAKEVYVTTDIDNSLVNMLKGETFNTVKINGKSYITLDIDVTPFCNPNVQKENLNLRSIFVQLLSLSSGAFFLNFEVRSGTF